MTCSVWLEHGLSFSTRALAAAAMSINTKDCKTNNSTGTLGVVDVGVFCGPDTLYTIISTTPHGTIKLENKKMGKHKNLLINNREQEHALIRLFMCPASLFGDVVGVALL